MEKECIQMLSERQVPGVKAGCPRLFHHIKAAHFSTVEIPFLSSLCSISHRYVTLPPACGTSASTHSECATALGDASTMSEEKEREGEKKKRGGKVLVKC